MFSSCKNSRCPFLEWFWLLIIALLTTVATGLISLYQLNGVDQAIISTRYYTMMVPANFTFQIWIVIYISWITLGIYQAYAYWNQNNSWIGVIRQKLWGHTRVSQRSIILLSVVMLLTIIWLFTWHFSMIFRSLLVMSLIFGALSYWWYRERPTEMKYVKWVMELATGWITVAIIANLGAFFVSADIVPDILSHRYFVYLIGLPALTIALGLFFRARSQIALGVLTWSILGLISARSGESLIQVLLIALLVWSLILNMFLGEKRIKLP